MSALYVFMVETRQLIFGARSHPITDLNSEDENQFSIYVQEKHFTYNIEPLTIIFYTKIDFFSRELTLES